ncbi:MAG: hypothetical protein ABIK89_17860 [Planctomycetota bacterium]
MSLSTYAYLLAAIELLAGVSFLVSPAKTAEWFLRFKDDQTTVRLVGASFFVISFLALTRGIAISVDVAGLIRLVVWIGAVKSLFICWFPDRYADQVEWIFTRPWLVRPFSLVALVAGALFLLAGNYLQGLGV